jgi:hypothetical protein
MLIIAAANRPENAPERDAAEKNNAILWMGHREVHLVAWEKGTSPQGEFSARVKSREVEHDARVHRAFDQTEACPGDDQAVIRGDSP